MQCEVYDTYVRKTDGQIMHFDIIVRLNAEYDDVLEFGHQFLNRVGQSGQQIQTELCRFCHIEQATVEVATAIEQNGHFILKMEGCPSEQKLTS